MNVGFTALKVVVQVVSEQVDQVYCVVSRVSLELTKFEFTQMEFIIFRSLLKMGTSKHLGVSGEEDKGDIADSLTSSCICRL